MNTADRLRRLTGEPRPPGAPDAGRNARLEALRRRVEAIMARQDSASAPEQAPRARGCAPLSDAVSGREVCTRDGEFFLRTFHCEGPHRHGNACLADVLSQDLKPAVMLTGDRRFGDVCWQDGLFLDTETTGLSGGTGTVPFLVGVGFFHRGSFSVHQLFLRDYGEERAALAWLREIVAEKRFIVSFNGKAFDLGLLATRFVLHRMADPFEGMPHADLLHPSRFLVGRRSVDHRLPTLESCLLDFGRSGDVDGREIPGIYFEWLRRRDPEPLVPVFVHNGLDVISLAFLFRRLLRLVTPLSCPSEGRPEDLLTTARFLDRRGFPDEALRISEAALACPGAGTREIRQWLSLRYKRLGRWIEAVRQWRLILEEDPHNVFAAEEMAKWLEHRARDVTAARKIVTGRLDSAAPLSGAERRALLARRDRLERREERRGSP